MNRVKGLVGEDSIVDLVFVLAAEGRLLEQHLVYQNAKCPPIYCTTVLFVEQDLGMRQNAEVGHTKVMQVTSGAINSGVPQNVLVVDP